MKKQRINVGDRFSYWEIKSIDQDRVECFCHGCLETTKWLKRRTILSKSSRSCGCQKLTLLRQQLSTDGKKTLKSRVKKSALINGWQVVTEPASNSQYVQCKCTLCNVESRLNYRKLLAGKQQCECTLRKHQVKVGDRIASWTVKVIGSRKVECSCVCGAHQQVDLFSLLDGTSQSCGCESKQNRLKTNLEKWGVENLFQHPKIRQQGKQAQIRVGRQHNINGKSLRQLAIEYGVPPTNVGLVLKEHGEQACIEYCKTYEERRPTCVEHNIIKLLEIDFPDLQKYDRNPTEFKINRKPDFRLARGDKILYVNGDGLFEHSEIGRRKLAKDYHSNLARDFRANGYQIFQFREDELRDKPNLIRSIIRNYFGIHSRKINARSCIIKEVKAKMAKEFFQANHLMGNISSKAFGLYLEDELVGCMSVRRKGSGIDISRFCTLVNASVRGGFSKLLKHIEKIYAPTFVQSFCDLRYSTGRSYELTGFTLESTTAGFQWTDCKKTFNRRMCKANMDERKLTQAEHAEELGWYKIYDAGQAKYVKRSKKDEDS